LFGPTALVAIAYVIGSGPVVCLDYFGHIDIVGPQRANLFLYVIPWCRLSAARPCWGGSVTTLTLVSFSVVAGGFLLVLADVLGWTSV
jgi:hypothetical protein